MKVEIGQTWMWVGSSRYFQSVVTHFQRKTNIRGEVVWGAQLQNQEEISVNNDWSVTYPGLWKLISSPLTPP